MRVKFKNSPYIRKSLKTTDRFEAISLAREYYLNQRARISLKMPVGTHSPVEVIREYIDHCGHINAVGSRVLAAYIEPFFSKYDDIVSLTDKDFVRYWHWRYNYWHHNDTTPNSGSNKVYYASKNPRMTTLKEEQRILNGAFDFAISRSYIKTKPNVLIPKEIRSKDDGSLYRGTFTIEEYRQIMKQLREDIKEAEDYEWKSIDAPVIASNFHREFHLRRLQTFLLIISNCGCRPSETVKLKFSDVEKWISPYDEDLGTEYCLINISAKVSKVKKARKVFARNAVSTFKAVNWFRQHHAKWNEDEDLIFCSTKERHRPASMYVAVTKFLEKYGMRRKNGQLRSAYSFRKFYSTMRIAEGTPISSLSKNMGTSIATLEKSYLLHETTVLRTDLVSHRMIAKDD